MPNYYLTSPIYYVNDKPHIGHAYTTLACDALARFKRLDGYDVKFLTGTDEHGEKVAKSASEKGMEPQSFTDQVSQSFRNLSGQLNFSNDDFIRTTESRHKKACQIFWQKLVDGGHIYLGKYAGWYAIRDESYYAESELVDGKAPTGAPVEWVEEPSYFFRLSAFQKPLLAHYKKHPEFVAPTTRMNEVKSFVEGGLNDLSVSRTSFSWGVPVPNDDKHIMYVWLEALVSYITAAGYDGKTGKAGTADWQKYWPADLHMVGKDILRFHAVYWPAFLMAAGVGLPKRVCAHGWWTNEGQKISKSLGNVIDPLELVARYGLDQMRYFLLREVPFGNDGDFSHRAMTDRMNNDLANDLGNLAQRVLAIVHRHCQATMPQRPKATTAADKQLLDGAYALLASHRQHYDRQQFHSALIETWQVVAAANRYVDAMQPWALQKTDGQRMAAVLWVVCEVGRVVAILLQPIMPDACGRLLDQLGVEAGGDAGAGGGGKGAGSGGSGKGAGAGKADGGARDFGEVSAERAMAGGQEIGKPQAVFPRFEGAG